MWLLNRNNFVISRFHFQHVAKIIESHIKKTKYFLKKLKELENLPKNVILGLYSNIPNEKSLASIRKHLDNRENKEVTTDTLVEFADRGLQNNYFQLLDQKFKQKWGTIATNFALLFSISSMVDLEDSLLCHIVIRP